MNEDVEFVPIKEREVRTYVIKVVFSAFTDDIDAEVEVLLEKGGSVPVDEGVETVNMPVVTVTV